MSIYIYLSNKDEKWFMVIHPIMGIVFLFHGNPGRMAIINLGKWIDDHPPITIFHSPDNSCNRASFRDDSPYTHHHSSARREVTT